MLKSLSFTHGRTYKGAKVSVIPNLETVLEKKICNNYCWTGWFKSGFESTVNIIFNRLLVIRLKGTFNYTVLLM